MVNYKCENCLKEFTRKNDLIYHIEKKKKPCKTNTQKILNITQKTQKTQKNSKKTEKTEKPEQLELKLDISVFNCQYCDKIFNRKYNLDRHINSCKKRNENINDEENTLLKNKINIQQQEIEKQNKQIEELKKLFFEFSKQQKTKNKKTVNKNNITNNNNNTQNNTNIETQNNNTQNNNINIIIPYGQELEKIQLSEVLNHMLTYDFDNMVSNLVKYIYLNDKKPENKNFVVNDIARNKCQYYDGEKWRTRKANDQILKLFENTNSLFTDPFDVPEIEKTLEFIRKNKKYADKYYTHIVKCNNFAKSLFDDSEKENIDKRQEILNELKLIFYSHRDEILKITL